MRQGGEPSLRLKYEDEGDTTVRIKAGLVCIGLAVGIFFCHVGSGIAGQLPDLVGCLLRQQIAHGCGIERIRQAIAKDRIPDPWTKMSRASSQRASCTAQPASPFRVQVPRRWS